MKITLNYLEQKNACQSGIDVFESEFGKSAELKDIINFCIKSKKSDYLSHANWLITKKMTKMQCVKYAIYAAEQVLHIYENKYPDDKRPRLAIEAAKKYLKNPSAAVADAARAAADAAAYAAYAAARAAADATADAAAADYVKMKSKILKYGLKIICEV